MLVDEFPVSVARHFAGALRTKIEEGYNLLVITGGQKESHEAIFQWMLRNCNGTGVVDWERYNFDDTPFSRYYHLREAARLIGCQWLETAFQFRMQQLTNKRLHSKDIEKLYKELGRGSEMADHMVQHVSSFFLEGDSYLGPYEQLCKDLADFGEDLELVIGPKLAFRKRLNEGRVPNNQIRGKRAGRFPFASKPANRSLSEQIISQTTPLPNNKKAEAQKEVGKSTDKSKQVEAVAKGDVKNGKDEITKADGKKYVVGADAIEQAENIANNIKNKAARRRAHKRLAKLKAAADDENDV